MESTPKIHRWYLQLNEESEQSKFDNQLQKMIEPILKTLSAALLLYTIVLSGHFIVLE